VVSRNHTKISTQSHTKLSETTQKFRGYHTKVSDRISTQKYLECINVEKEQNVHIWALCKTFPTPNPKPPK
jgi:hypothetical protein